MQSIARGARVRRQTLTGGKLGGNRAEFAGARTRYLDNIRALLKIVDAERRAVY